MVTPQASPTGGQPQVRVPAAGGPPRLVIAAPASGHGKTTVATGLIAALRARGFAVSPHKVGPDYIDPGYHALAAGRVARNLDAWLTAPELIAPLFLHGAADADVAVVEGVMGLFDGVAGGAEGIADFASTAHVARLLQAPVVLVVDATAQAGSVAALVHGFATYDPAVQLAGVILNRVGSDRHELILRAALAGLGVPVLGALRRADSVSTPSRHLGLVPVAERSADALAAVEAMGALIDRCCDVDAILAVAASAPRMTAAPWDPHLALGPTPRGGYGRPRIAIAGGAAFTFSYAEHAELLAAAGAEVVTVDPLADDSLPPRTSAFVVGGGFPEVYAEALSQNERLRKDVADLAASGGVVVGECAGLLYLAEELANLPMCGVLGLRAEMGPRLTVGYRRAKAVVDSVLCAAGEQVRGHEFHRTTVAAHPATAAEHTHAWQLRPAGMLAGGAAEAGSGEQSPLADLTSADLPSGTAEGYVTENVHASYLHLHWAGHPRLVRRLVAAAARVETRERSGR